MHTLKWPGRCCRYTGQGRKEDNQGHPALQCSLSESHTAHSTQDNVARARRLIWWHGAWSKIFSRLSPHLPHFPLEVKE